MNAYIKGRYTLTNGFLKADTLEFPTITLCISPGQKKSIGLKYDFEYYDSLYEKEFDNSTLIERYEELSYLIERDFNLLMNEEVVRVGKNVSVSPMASFEDSRGGFFEIKPLRTLALGTCYTVKPLFEISAEYAIQFEVELTSSISEEDLPSGLRLFFTSNETWANIPDQLWPQVPPSTKWLTFGGHYTEFYANMVEHHFNEGQDTVTACLTKIANQTSCPVKCHILSSYDLPACKTIKDFQCIVDEITTPVESKCYSVKKFLNYKIIREDARRFQSQRKKSIEFYVGMWSMNKELKEEIEVLSTADFIGSIGGSLGMFFGFSIITTCTYLLKKIFDKF